MSTVSHLAAVFFIIKYEKYRREWIERRALISAMPSYLQADQKLYVLCDI